MTDNALGFLRQAKALIQDELGQYNCDREISLTITKIDEAILWRAQVLSLKKPNQDESNGNNSNQK